MRSQIFGKQLRSSSLSTIPPPQTSTEHSPRLAELAARILFRSPLPSQNDLPVYILTAAALPDKKDTDFDALLPYVLARLPDEDQLIGGRGYEVVFFAGGREDGTIAKKEMPGWTWFLQAYQVLSRAMRKRLQKLYIIHEKNWIRVLAETFSTIVSPKFRKKIVHASSLSSLALYLAIEDLLIPPSVYHYDRRVSPNIHAPYSSGRRAFGAANPFPESSQGSLRLPRVLREATSFLLMEQNLKTLGLFRINPRTVSIDVLREAYDRGQKFIVWKEGSSVLTFSHWRQGFGEVLVDDLEQAEGFGLFCAAGLIKRWYAELRNPIFPKSCYPQLQRLYGEEHSPIEVSRILELISVDSEWSLITKTSRVILTTHLLPLLSQVIECQDWNQMTSYNLAVCFAPTLLRGPDPIEDTKISATIIRILEVAITSWTSHLALACDMTDSKFGDSLRLPESREDREDPLDDGQSSCVSEDIQIDGITLVDNDGEDEVNEDLRPPLPPRPVSNVPNATRRKPAPSLRPPPRYSTIIGQEPGGMDQLPNYSTTIEEATNGNLSSDTSFLDTAGPSQLNNTVPRKPIPKPSKGS